MATGEYSGIYHHYEVMMTDNLESKLRLLMKKQNLSFVHSNIVLRDSTGEVVSWNIWNEDSRHDYIDKRMRVFQRYLAYYYLGGNILLELSSPPAML